MIVLPCHCARSGHTKRNGYSVGCVAGDKGVVYALTGLWKAGKPPPLAERIEPVHTAGQHFMHIALVPDIEHEPVAAGVKDAVNGNRRLDNAEVGGQMSAGAADVLYKKLSDLAAERPQLVLGDIQQILSGMYGI